MEFRFSHALGYHVHVCRDAAACTERENARDEGEEGETPR
jgi:hypothetical protein